MCVVQKIFHGNVSLSERRSQTDAKPRAISSLLEYCRGAKEGDEVNSFGLCRATETMEQREERLILFKLSRVATEEDEVKRR